MIIHKTKKLIAEKVILFLKVMKNVNYKKEESLDEQLSQRNDS